MCCLVQIAKSRMCVSPRPVRTMTSAFHGRSVCGSNQNHSPPSRPRSLQRSALQQLLEVRDAAGVRRLIATDPDVAWQPIFENRMLPPACCAALYMCGPEIMRDLIGNGSSLVATDFRGRSPLQLVCEWRPSVWRTARAPIFSADALPRPVYELAMSELPTLLGDVSLFVPIVDFEPEKTMVGSELAALRVAKVMLASGADPENVALNGTRAADIAWIAGRHALSRLCYHYRDAQACFTLCRAAIHAAGRCSLACLSQSLAQAISAFLLPCELHRSVLQCHQVLMSRQPQNEGAACNDGRNRHPL